MSLWIGGLAGVLTVVTAVTALLQLDFRRARRASGLPGMGLADTTVVLTSEAIAFVWVGWWHLRAPFGGRVRTPERVDGRPVLCVHGYTQNSTNFWGLRQALEAQGRPTRCVFLGLAWPWRRLEGYTTALEAELEALADEPDGVDLVAHSMGGLVLRIVLYQRPELAAVLRSVVTIGTPHAGTALARLGAIRPLDQLAHGGEFLRMLPSLDALVPHGRITTVGSESDMVVYPVETAFPPGVHHIRFRRVGHAGLLVHVRCIEATVGALRSG